MNESTSYSPELDVEIERELNNLFALQDKNITEKKLGIWMQEIRQSRIPLAAMLAGIKSLKGEDVAKLTYATVCGAARRYVIPDNETRPACRECSHGMVLMKDDDGHVYSLACQCWEGENKAKTHGLVRWNGDTTQNSKGRIIQRISEDRIIQQELAPF